MAWQDIDNITAVGMLKEKYGDRIDAPGRIWIGGNGNNDAVFAYHLDGADRNSFTLFRVSLDKVSSDLKPHATPQEAIAGGIPGDADEGVVGKEVVGYRVMVTEKGVNATRGFGLRLDDANSFFDNMVSAGENRERHITHVQLEKVLKDGTVTIERLKDIASWVDAAVKKWSVEITEDGAGWESGDLTEQQAKQFWNEMVGKAEDGTRPGITSMWLRADGVTVDEWHSFEFDSWAVKRWWKDDITGMDMKASTGFGTDEALARTQYQRDIDSGTFTKLQLLHTTVAGLEVVDEWPKKKPFDLGAVDWIQVAQLIVAIIGIILAVIAVAYMMR